MGSSKTYVHWRFSMSTIVGTNIEVTNIKYDSDTTAMIVSSAGGGAATVPEGIAKAWFAQMSASGQSVNGDTLNYSSYEDPGVGRSNVTGTNVVAATNCCVVGSSHLYDYGHYQVTTSKFQFASVNSGGSYTDNTTHGIVFGDLA